MGDLARLRWVVLGALIAVALVSSLVALLSGSHWQDALLNFGTEMAGAVVTYALFELIIERREQRKVRETELELRKEGLIAQMGSRVADVAVAAAEELQRCGWLQDGTLQGADLVGANLRGANLLVANLEEANLVSANLQEAILMSANLRGANLRDANLQKAILVDAELQWANLRGAELQGANLQGEDFGWLILGGAELQGAILEEAQYNNATTWPEGFTPPPEAINVDAEANVED
jgi:uncharacterized protein YjbI with pentapeptide repeats